MIVTVFVLTIILPVIFWKNVYRKKCLPGPWNLPVIGYLHKLNPAAPYLTLTELAKKYGPVYSIKLGFVNVVVIAEVKILKKVLAKNEALERPSLYMTNTTFENKGTTFEPDKHRKFHYRCRTRFHTYRSMERSTQICGKFFKNSRSR